MQNLRRPPDSPHRCILLDNTRQQLARLVSKRPDPAQLERQHPELMKAGTLALVFEERVMPRAAAGSGAGAATIAEAGDKEGEVVAETGGGPEHMVSFDALLTWPDVQVKWPGGKRRLLAKVVVVAGVVTRNCCSGLVYLAGRDGWSDYSQWLRCTVHGGKLWLLVRTLLRLEWLPATAVC